MILRIEAGSVLRMLMSSKESGILVNRFFQGQRLAGYHSRLGVEAEFHQVSDWYLVHLHIWY